MNSFPAATLLVRMHHLMLIVKRTEPMSLLLVFSSRIRHSISTVPLVIPLSATNWTKSP
jgi:hypothetical protein